VVGHGRRWRWPRRRSSGRRVVVGRDCALWRGCARPAAGPGWGTVVPRRRRSAGPPTRSRVLSAAAIRTGWPFRRDRARRRRGSLLRRHRGHRDRLARLREAVCVDDGARPRNRALWSLALADGLARSGDVAQACTVAGGALPLIGELSSARVRRQLRDVAGRVAPCSAVTGVREFRQQVAAIGVTA